MIATRIINALEPKTRSDSTALWTYGAHISCQLFIFIKIYILLTFMREYLGYGKLSLTEETALWYLISIEICVLSCRIGQIIRDAANSP